MPLVMTAWPVLALLLPALVLALALWALARGDRRAVLQLLALVACYLIGALLMEFSAFIGALMARQGGDRAVPVLGAGTRLLLDTLASPRSIAAPPLSLPALAAYGLLASYLWVLLVLGLHLQGRRGGSGGRSAKAAPAAGQRKGRKGAAAG